MEAVPPSGSASVHELYPEGDLVITEHLPERTQDIRQGRERAQVAFVATDTRRIVAAFLAFREDDVCAIRGPLRVERIALRQRRGQSEQLVGSRSKFVDHGCDSGIRNRHFDQSVKTGAQFAMDGDPSLSFISRKVST
jgi:hypothetical protein